MPSTRAKPVLVMLGCACAALSNGCSAPWAAAPATPAQESRHTAPPQASQLPASEAEAELSSVFDKLQQIRAIDPAAEQKLVAKLRQTPTESWPLVAEQFRASLAYREQLKNRGQSTLPALESTTAAVERDAKSTMSPFLGSPFLARDSMAIGALVDPRCAERDDVAVVTESAPYTMQVQLADTLASTDSSERSAVHTAAHQTAAPTVVQARLEAVEAEPQDNAAADPDWQQLVEQAAEDLARRVALSPTTTAEIHQHVSLRMLRLLSGDTDKALEPIPHIAPVEQDYWSRQLFALATYLDHHTQPDDKRRAAASAVHLDESVSHLRELGSLALRNLAFCTNVLGYGAIEPYESDRFSPGERVTLYVEVENYHSESTEKGFRTLLGSNYELLNDKSERVGGGEFPEVDDYCRSRRRDFHIQFGIALPEQLPPGEYRLQLVVKDRQSEKMGSASAAFEIRGNRP